MRSYWCPDNVDNVVQFDEAMRKMNNNGDDICFHAHGIEEECPATSQEMLDTNPKSDECWKTA